MMLHRYFYDKKVYEESPVIKSYLESIFLSGAIIYDTLRFSPYLREDDYIVTVFGFPVAESIHDFNTSKHNLFLFACLRRINIDGSIELSREFNRESNDKSK